MKVKQNHNGKKEGKKKLEKALAVGVGLRQVQGLGSGRGLCLGPTGPEKALGGGVGLRLNAAGGAQECLWPWRMEDQVWDPSRLPGPVWAGKR